jgi:hypothetical protein
MSTTTEYKIEDGVPLPSSANRGRKAIYPWAELKNGQSFLVPTESELESAAVAAKLRVNAAARKARHGETFSICKVDGGVRVWRVHGNHNGVGSPRGKLQKHAA